MLSCHLPQLWHAIASKAVLGDISSQTWHASMSHPLHPHACTPFGERSELADAAQ